MLIWGENASCMLGSASGLPKIKVYQVYCVQIILHNPLSFSRIQSYQTNKQRELFV